MESDITKRQIELFKKIIEEFEPYPLEVLDSLQYDDKDYDEDRINATIAKKILLEHGITDFFSWESGGTKDE